MADSPLEPDAAREQRIRERAYHLWERDGHPQGRDLEYWARASELIAVEDGAGAGQVQSPETHPTTPRETGVAAAERPENLGQSPARAGGADDAQPTPKPPRRPRKTKAPATVTKAPTRPRQRKT